MTILYSNGCSYTANFDLLRQDRYPIILAERLGWEVRDRAEPGSCNARIIRTTIGDCVKLKSESNDKIVALIQLSHLMRTEYPDSSNPLGDPFYSIKPESKQLNINNDISKYGELYWRLHNDKQVLLNLITSLIGLISYFKQNNIQYLLYLGPKENNLYIKNLKDDLRFNILKNDSGVVDIEKFYMLEIPNRKNVHPDVDGMKKIADYFYNLLNTSN